MPELPEVETTRRGIAPLVIGQRIAQVVIRNPHLRWPVPSELEAELRGRVVTDVGRRGKYLLFGLEGGTLILHLGMSGRLCLLIGPRAVDKHDHFDLEFANGYCLRLHDPRRFGSVSWTRAAPLEHPLLAHLGPEPLEHAFDGHYLYRQARGRKTSVKSLIMDSRVVVGVGNIYANEALFLAGIRPTRPAGRISLARYRQLADTIRQVLGSAIAQGGTTLRDFLDSAGRPGYFEQHLQVYGRQGLPCPRCGGSIRLLRQGQRSTYHCPRCQH
jgi:formamidopyrimidine-DNA glycosylase